MNAAVLDVDRIRKCVELMRRGATAGERAAGEAAAKRVAAVGGLSLEDALLHADGAQRLQEAREVRQPASKRAGPKSRSNTATKAGPITVEELLAEKARHAEWLKKKAAREEKRLRNVCAAQEAEAAAIREEQTRRDREWAERRAASP